MGRSLEDFLYEGLLLLKYKRYCNFSALFAYDEVQKTANLAIKDRTNHFFEKELRPQFRGFFELSDFEGAYKNKIIKKT